MQEEDFDREIKVLVIGNGGVGKTSMIRRFCKGIFTDEYKKTIGVDFLEKAQFIDSLQEEVRFMLWDTAGQEEFDAITRTYYRGAGAAVLAFSTTDRPSFDAVAMWKGKVEAECGDIAMCLVQNKVDLIDRSEASVEEVESLARRLGLKLYRTCVKENVNVSEVFMYLAELHQKKLNNGTLNQMPAAATAGTPMAASAATAAAGGQRGSGNAAQPSESQIGGSWAESPAAAPTSAPPRSSAGRAEEPSQGQAQTVTLGPSKMRTKGKKSLSDKLKCSIA